MSLEKDLNVSVSSTCTHFPFFPVVFTLGPIKGLFSFHSLFWSASGENDVSLDIIGLIETWMKFLFKRICLCSGNKHGWGSKFEPFHFGREVLNPVYLFPQTQNDYFHPFSFSCIHLVLLLGQIHLTDVKKKKKNRRQWTKQFTILIGWKSALHNQRNQESMNVGYFNYALDQLLFCQTIYPLSNFKAFRLLLCHEK